MYSNDTFADQFDQFKKRQSEIQNSEIKSLVNSIEVCPTELKNLIETKIVNKSVKSESQKICHEETLDDTHEFINLPLKNQYLSKTSILVKNN